MATKKRAEISADRRESEIRLRREIREFDKLVARSSLGTEGAQQLSRRVSNVQMARVLRLLSRGDVYGPPQITGPADHVARLAAAGLVPHRRRGPRESPRSDRHWVVTFSYPDAGVEMAAMDSWEDALGDLDAAAARVPSDGTIELRLYVVCSTEAQALAIATNRAREVTGLVAAGTTAAACPPTGKVGP